MEDRNRTCVAWFWRPADFQLSLLPHEDDGRIRTGDQGVAVPCLTTWLHRHIISAPYQNRTGINGVKVRCANRLHQEGLKQARKDLNLQLQESESCTLPIELLAYVKADEDRIELPISGSEPDALPIKLLAYKPMMGFEPMRFLFTRFCRSGC